MIIGPNRISLSLILLNQRKADSKVVNVQKVASKIIKSFMCSEKQALRMWQHMKNSFSCASQHGLDEPRLPQRQLFLVHPPKPGIYICHILLHFHIYSASVAFLAASSHLVLHPTASMHTERVPRLMNLQRTGNAVRMHEDKHPSPGWLRGLISAGCKSVGGRHAGRTER